MPGARVSDAERSSARSSELSSARSVLDSARKISFNEFGAKKPQRGASSKKVLVKTVDNPSGMTAPQRLKAGTGPEIKVAKILDDAVFDNDGEAVLGFGYQDLHKRTPCGFGCDVNATSYRTPMGLALFASPWAICPLVEMETRRYGAACCCMCPVHFFCNPLFCFQGAFFWWPIIFIPRCICNDKYCETPKEYI